MSDRPRRRARLIEHGRAAFETLLLERVLRRPFVFEDSRGLRYVLYPGENARAYLDNRGNYEVAETRFCGDVLSPGDVAVDVGANIGLYTLLFSRLVGEHGRVHSFEPAPENARRLRVNLLLNGAENVHLAEQAVYSRSGTVTLNLFGEGLGPWNTLGRPTLPDPFNPGRTVSPSSSVDVPATTLDEYAAAALIDRIALLKIDVEGAEPDVLAGAARLLAEHRIGTIMFEVSLPQSETLGHDATEPFAQLEAAGYATHRIEPDGSLGARVARAEERYANYAAVLADG